jgi:hypothetical protein
MRLIKKISRILMSEPYPKDRAVRHAKKSLGNPNYETENSELPVDPLT